MTAPASIPFAHRHLLGIEGLSPCEIDALLDLADAYVELNRQVDKKQSVLRGRTQINVFFESSTRTRTSFELAGKRLGADTINMSIEGSAIKKGETLIDTAMTLNAMHPDVLVVRHPESGAVELLSQKVDCAVVNAGDGSHEHPTQALLDALTIRRRRGKLGGLCIAICGDVLHSRVARSNILLPQRHGRGIAGRRSADAAAARGRAPRRGPVHRHARRTGRLRHHHDAAPADRAHARLVRPVGAREYFALYGLDREKLALAKRDALVMHPGPMNRGVEIDTEIADDIDRSVIREQVEMGGRPCAWHACMRCCCRSPTSRPRTAPRPLLEKVRSGAP